MVPDNIIETGPGALSGYYEWFDTAIDGGVLQYHLGDLAYDRNPDHHRGLTSDRRRDIDALNTLANRVLADAREGHLKLFQRRLSESVYAYFAVRRARSNVIPLTKKVEQSSDRNPLHV